MAMNEVPKTRNRADHRSVTVVPNFISSPAACAGTDQGAAMKFTITEGHFTTEAEAFAEIASRGWHAIARDVVAEEEELHWHDFDTVVFIVEGTARAAFEDGSVLEAGAGARVEASARLSVDPAEMTRPVNKPAAERD